MVLLSPAVPKQVILVMGCVGGSCLVSSDVNDAADSLNDLSNALNDLSDAYN